MMVRKHILGLRVRQALFGSIAIGMASVALAAPQEKASAPDVATLDRITVTAQSRE